ncbi:MAG: alanyl-tRNA editing protein [Gemmatimonadota bacterium]
MTKRLYYTDADLLHFDAVAIAYDGDPLRVILDQTAFYPTSGGQPHDTGVLKHAHVIDVIDADTHIIHVLDSAIPLGPVHGRINRGRRFDNMQQHTAQHLLSALADVQFGWATASVHFGPTHSTIEFDTAEAGEKELESLEQLAGAAVVMAAPVSVGFEDAATAVGLRKPSEREGEIRIISIAGIDRSACGGTHVSSTAHLGPIFLTDVEKIRGHVRVSFLAGDRAMAFAKSRAALVRTLAQQLSCSVEELPLLVPKRQEELAAARARIEVLERDIAQLKLAALIAAVAPDASGLRRVVYRAEGETGGMLRAMAQSVASMRKVLFVATTSPPPSVYVGSSADSDIDAGAALKAALVTVGGRGGGSARAAQGTAPDASRLRDVVDAITGER